MANWSRQVAIPIVDASVPVAAAPTAASFVGKEEEGQSKNSTLSRKICQKLSSWYVKSCKETHANTYANYGTV